MVVGGVGRIPGESKYTIRASGYLPGYKWKQFAHLQHQNIIDVTETNSINSLFVHMKHHLAFLEHNEFKSNTKQRCGCETASDRWVIWSWNGGHQRNEKRQSREPWGSALSLLQESGLLRPINPQRIKSVLGDKSVNNASSDIMLANQALFRRWTDQWEGGLAPASFLSVGSMVSFRSFTAARTLVLRFIKHHSSNLRICHHLKSVSNHLKTNWKNPPSKSTHSLHKEQWNHSKETKKAITERRRSFESE